MTSASIARFADVARHRAAEAAAHDDVRAAVKAASKCKTAPKRRRL